MLRLQPRNQQMPCMLRPRIRKPRCVPFVSCESWIVLACWCFSKADLLYGRMPPNLRPALPRMLPTRHLLMPKPSNQASRSNSMISLPSLNRPRVHSRPLSRRHRMLLMHLKSQPPRQRTLLRHSHQLQAMRTQLIVLRRMPRRMPTVHRMMPANFRTL